LDREQLLAAAVAVGLVLGVDFEKNISSINLQKKIDDKKAEIEARLKGDSNDTPPPKPQSDNEILDSILKGLETGDLKEEDLSDHQKELLEKDRLRVAELKKQKEPVKKVEIEDDNALIKRETVCKSYRTKIKGFEEAARRSGVTVDEVKESIDSGKPVGGYTFTFLG
jgi:hypothetical protein